MQISTVGIKRPVAHIERSFEPEAAFANRTTDAHSNSTRTDYDAEGRKTRDVDADGVAFTYSYDADGRPTGSVDAAGNATGFLYGNLPGSNSAAPGVQAGVEGLLAAVLYPTYREDYRFDVRNRQTQPGRVGTLCPPSGRSRTKIIKRRDGGQRLPTLRKIARAGRNACGSGV